MCEFCIKHGEGKKWYENMGNYSREVFLQVNSEEKLQHFLLHFGQSMRDGLVSASKWKKRLPAIYGFLVHPWLTNRQKKSHFGQILPIEDVEYIVDQVRSIVRLPCICRKINTGNAKRYCYAVGRGCRQCQKKCYFDAIRYDRRQQKCQVDIRNCYGCGTCRATCQEDAISLLDRRSIPLVADSW